MTETTELIEVVTIKYRNRGKAYTFDPAGLELSAGQKVVVETSKGLELGTVVQGIRSVPSSQIVKPLRPVIRVATEDDLRIEKLCREREREAYIIGRQKIAAHGLEMKLVDVECSFSGNKILFFFSSDGRVDFRELVKDLASVFRTRIELRQIGVRDEARMLGGLGICGRPFCCGSFMEEFAPVTTKMAKTQSMSLNPAKISGCCGRLMCCLRYEQAAYEELVKNVPKNGAFVETPDGYGNVTQVNILRQTVKVKLDGPGEDSFRTYDAEDVAAVPGGRPRDGSSPPHVLVLRPKEPAEPEEPDDSGWDTLPDLLISDPGEQEPATVRQEMSRRVRPHHETAAQENREGAAKPRSQRSHPQKQGSVGAKTEGAGKAKNASAGKRGNKHRQNKQKTGVQTAVPKEKSAAPAQEKPAQEGGATKAKKPYRGHYRNRNKRRGGDGAPKQGG